jgi:hypothetical protein
MLDIGTKQNRLNKKAEQFREQVIKKLLKLADNPRIKRISDKAFILKSSNLGDNFSPEHHDFALCYRLIAELLRKKPVTEVYSTIVAIIETGQYRDGSCKINLHPDVIKNLDNFIHKDFYFINFLIAEVAIFILFCLICMIGRYL